MLTIIESVNSSDSGDSEIKDSSANDKIIVIVMILQLLLTVTQLMILRGQLMSIPTESASHLLKMQE